jgi:hypothetical protein
MLMTKEKRDTIVSVLYEKCSNGEISLNQRELLIRKANNMLITESSIDSDNSSASIEFMESAVESEKSELSPKEKYKMFKECVYTKCAKGEITVEMRESLLEKAREKFFPISE